MLMFTPNVPLVCREVHRVLKPGAPFITTVWQGLQHCDIFGSGIMRMMVEMREAGRMPMPDPSKPPPANPCNLADSAPVGPLGDALTAAGFTDVAAEEYPYEIFIAGADPQDVAARFISATPFQGDILEHGGAPLLAEATAHLASIFGDAGHEMVELAGSVPQWSGADKPDGLTAAMRFKTNTALYVTAKRS